MKRGLAATCMINIFVFCFFFQPDELLAMTKYTVKPGDTLWEISKKNQVRLKTLLNLNQHIYQPELIFPGQTIFLPDQEQQKVHVEEGYQQTLLTLINSERRKQNLKPLAIQADLNSIAEKKAKDMLIHKYVKHKSPTYGNPKDMLETFNFPFKKVEENIGAGSKSPEEMYTTWINSQVNRNNMLSKQATFIGIGFAEGGLHQNYWTLLIVEN